MRKRIALSPRKKPKQDRSRRMREDILTATVRVLRKEGPLRFTTWRVAEVAGVSVGSLYQYFPNKQSLVFAVHARLVELAWAEVQRVLDSKRWSAREKIRRVARLFFLAESDEVREMGAALKDAEVFFEDQPEHRAAGVLIAERFTRFVRDSLPPRTPRARVNFGAQLIMTVIESVGKSIAGRDLAKRDVDRWARACADMVADYLRLA
jgi:AcrR family transcriptional regulator